MAVKQNNNNNNNDKNGKIGNHIDTINNESFLNSNEIMTNHENISKNNIENRNCIQYQTDRLELLINRLNNVANDHSNFMNKEQHSTDSTVTFANEIIVELSKHSLPTKSDDIKIFIEKLQSMFEIFAKITGNDLNYLLNFLLQVMKLIIPNPEEQSHVEPSCSIAIIFQLFAKEKIPKAIEFILNTNELNINNNTISIIVELLCLWLRRCTFCPNLNLWILLILNNLREQNKSYLLLQIAQKIIDPLFLTLILPIFRSKVFPIIYHTLLYIKDTPIIFLKIIARAPKILRQIQQEVINSKNNGETKQFFQELIDLISLLINRFPQKNQYYKETQEILDGYKISENYKSLTENYFIETNSKNPKVGLVNLGNTCYMNSVVQALVMTKDFCRDLILMDCKSSLLQKCQQLFAQLLHSQRPELNPSSVLHATRPPYFLPGLQQDSSEFLGYLLETFHEQESNSKNINQNQINNIDQNIINISDQKLEQNIDINNEMNLTITKYRPQLIDNNDCSKMQIDLEDGNSLISNEDQHPPKIDNCPTNNNQKYLSLNQQLTRKLPTIIDNIFTGKIAIKYKCSDCNWQSNNIDEFREISLSFPETNDTFVNYSIQDLINYYCSPETLKGANQYFCEKCIKLCNAERFINIVNAPKNLILTLKQFKYDKNNHMRAKLMNKIRHNENITLNVYNSVNGVKNSIQFQYSLYAVVVHSGFSMDSGHYYTYAKDNLIKNCDKNNGDTKQWYKFNDNIVSACKITELYKLNPPNTPYILFYRMQPKLLISVNDDNYGNNSNLVQKNDIVPRLDELPLYLQCVINNDNIKFQQEIMLRNSNLTARTTRSMTNSRRRNDDDDDQPPPQTNSSNQILNANMKDFIY